MGLKEELEKGVDVILDEMLTALQNKDPDLDVSKGSLLYIRSAAHAGANWGVRQGIRYVLRQLFPDTADTTHLERHAWLYALARETGETDAELLERLLNRIQQPPSGGNENDYETWAAATSVYVARAFCYQLDPDIGSVGVLVLADEDTTGSEQPSSHTGISGDNTSVPEEPNKLVDSGADFVNDGVATGDEVSNDDTEETAIVTVVDSGTTLSLDADIFPSTPAAYSIKSLLTQAKDYILDRCPVDVHTDRLTVFGPTIQTQAVTIIVLGADKSEVKADIEAYMKSLTPGETLYVSRLVSIAIDNGATNASVSVPPDDVAPDPYYVIRPDTVTVN